MGKEAAVFLDDLPNPAPESEAQLLVVSADCKGVPLVKEDAAKVAAFETAKKNPGNRRVATVAMAWIIRQVNARRRNGLVYLRNMIRSERHSLASDFCVSCEAKYRV
jgi:hypothetical protein